MLFPEIVSDRCSYSPDSYVMHVRHAVRISNASGVAMKKNMVNAEQLSSSMALKRKDGPMMVTKWQFSYKITGSTGSPYRTPDNKCQLYLLFHFPG